MRPVMKAMMKPNKTMDEMTDALSEPGSEPADEPDPAGEIDVFVRAAAWQPFVPALRHHAEYLWQALKLPSGDMGLVLTDDADMASLNATYRNKAQPTNVLSFPAQDLTPGEMPATAFSLGDVVMAIETVTREARAAAIGVDAHALHLLTHGMLHLLGHTHEGAADAGVMEALEIDLLAAVGIANPYLREAAQ